MTNDSLISLITELANMYPGDDEYGYDCKFCHLSIMVGDEDKMNTVSNHERECIWRRAKELLGRS